ncbi:Carbohydrate binding domain (Family 11) [Tenacibaculum sp. 190524A05c]|uniref:Ig-like domain-containing protein n=1 Tax=Tenacibaculum platacis TaxID=3137852 RepID=UPI0031FAA024
MKTNKYIYSKITTFFLGLILCTTIGCERGLSEEAEFATYPTEGGIFIDGFVGGLDYFPFGGSFAEAFSVDQTETYMGTASMRFDIPSFGVGFGGATFQSLGPRDLSGFDALTFWAKASQGADINEIGFGIDGDTGNKFQVTLQNLQLSTAWKKYVIPIPDASKLNQERGMFWYAEGAENEFDEGGYTFWIDELQFEKLGTVAQPRPRIMGGQDMTQETFNGSVIQINGTQTFNIGTGENITSNVAPAYFEFTSSNPDVAFVDESGRVTVLTQGTTVITASLGGVAAEGSLTLNSSGDFTPAPTPPARNPEDVVSVFSNAYANINIDFYNGFFGGQTTLGGAVDLGAENVIQYTGLNFVTVQFSNPTVDVSQMTTLHIDIKVDETVANGDAITIELGDFGSDGVFGGVGSDDSAGSATPITGFVQNQWLSIDIPINSFTGGTGAGFSGLANTANLAQVTFVSSTISNITVDNIYFYK